jgi:hypothetical protein
MNKRLLPWIRKNLKKIAGTSCAMLLAGCASVAPTTSTGTAATGTAASTISAQAAWFNACYGPTGYRPALQTVTELGKAGLLPKSAIPQINLMDQNISPLCESTTPPANITAATSQITAAVTKLGIDEALAVAAAKQGVKP